MNRSRIARRIERLAPLLQPDERCLTCCGWTWARLCDPSGMFCLNPTPCPQCGTTGSLADIIVIDTWGPGGEMNANDPLEAIAAAHAFALFHQLGPSRTLGKVAAWMEAMDGPLPDGVLVLGEG